MENAKDMQKNDQSLVSEDLEQVTGGTILETYNDLQELVENGCSK